MANIKQLLYKNAFKYLQISLIMIILYELNYNNVI